jgi:hypothetical protein
VKDEDTIDTITDSFYLDCLFGWAWFLPLNYLESEGCYSATFCKSIKVNFH